MTHGRGALGLVNPGLFVRALRELIGPTVVLGVLMGGVSMLLAYALPRIQARFMERNFIPPGVREFRNAIFGIDSSSAGVAEVAFSLAWSHPIVLSLVFAHAIVSCTRVPAAEVERGTIDVLLALPISRWALHVSETLAWLVCAALAMGLLFLGSFAGAQFIKPEFRPDWSNLAMVLGNLALVYAAVGAAAMLLATLTDRRARAVLAVVVLTVVSLLINFLYLLDPALEFTKRIAFLSVLEYYKPIRILMEEQWPWRNSLILLGVAGGLWTAAGIVLSRRDITTT